MTYRTPITFFKKMTQRVVFAIVSFLILFSAILCIYSDTAMWQYEIVQAEMKKDSHEQVIKLVSSASVPGIEIELIEGLHGGWNLHLMTQNFVFSPENEGKAHVDGVGHAHLYINGEKVARLYGPWYHIKDLPKGKHKIKVALTSNNHSEYAVDGTPVADTMVLINN